MTQKIQLTICNLQNDINKVQLTKYNSHKIQQKKDLAINVGSMLQRFIRKCYMGNSQNTINNQQNTIIWATQKIQNTSSKKYGS